MDSSKGFDKNAKPKMIDGITKLDSEELELVNMNKGWFTESSKPSASEIIYFFQVFSIFIVIIASLYNLSVKNGDEKLWLSLLSMFLGYLMPNPKIKNDIKTIKEVHL